ncbi:T9SS type A sorting domain-containing protein [Ferruginibacter sp. SUN106]|uniref:T9SS type A sorting domain-containing protein n=1 Tax=Ferruginibacter sp. SUN106 TaxID=2978348 RepID=UPI003D366C75
MKKIFTLVIAIAAGFIATAQTCTTSGFDICDPAKSVSSDFRNAVQLNGTGSPLTVGAKYKFSNAIPALNLDAVISIDAIVNATLAGAGSPTIDDDGIVTETGAAGSGASLFSPRIAPDQQLSCTSRSGYVEFSIKFYTHSSGNGAPVSGTEMAVANLNLLSFDMDGFNVGNNGWFKEISYAKTNAFDPANYSAPATELLQGGNVGGWLLTYGSTAERTGVAGCTEIIERSVYSNLQTAISFRMGYDYKAPGVNCNSSSIQPTRDYGVRFGCFNLPAAGPLPVSLVDFAASYAAGKTIVTWTSLQEHNLDSYEIQRSFDGINFEVAGNVKANNLTSTQEYSFTDDVTAFNSKYIYYRIRIADLEYSMKLTNTVIIKIASPKGNEMLVSPNPSSSHAQIKVITKKAGKGDITVFDATGKLVLKQQASLLEGNNTIIINNITSLSEGYYTIRLTTNNESFSSKLLIWK